MGFAFHSIFSRQARDGSAQLKANEWLSNDANYEDSFCVFFSYFWEWHGIVHEGNWGSIYGFLLL